MTWWQRLARGHGLPGERRAAWAVLGQAAAAGGAGGPLPALPAPGTRPAWCMGLAVPIMAPCHGVAIAGCHQMRHWGLRDHLLRCWGAWRNRFCLLVPVVTSCVPSSFWPGALSSACPIPALLWKHLGHAGAKPWQGHGKFLIQDGTKFQGDIPVSRDWGCSRQAKEGSSPLWGILTWDAGTETSLSPEGTGEGGATGGCRVGVLPAPPGGHGSPETVLTASSGTKFPPVAGQWTAGSGVGANDSSEPSVVTN